MLKGGVQMKARTSKSILCLMLTAVMLFSFAGSGIHAVAETPEPEGDQQSAATTADDTSAQVPGDDTADETEVDPDEQSAQDPGEEVTEDEKEAPDDKSDQEPAAAVNRAAAAQTVEPPEFIEVRVPAIWYPIDLDTHEVIPGLNPIPTNPEMYELPEFAKRDSDGIYQIDYMGILKESPSQTQHSNFMYTGNLFFTDRFHRIVAQGCSFLTIPGTVSSVFKVAYGAFIDENYTNGLYGFSSTPYQEGETLHLYVATQEGNLSDASFFQNELTIISTDDNSIRAQLIDNIDEVTYHHFGAGYSDYNPSAVFEPSNIETIWLYKYDQDDPSTGEFIMGPDGDYQNFTGGGFSSLEAGRYEVVFPIYWKEPIPEYLSAPDKFSRNRYTFDDTFHFTLNYVPGYTVEVTKTLSGATLPSDFYIELVGEYEYELYRAAPLQVAEEVPPTFVLDIENADSFEDGVYRWVVTHLAPGTYTATEYNYTISGMTWSGVATVTKTIPEMTPMMVEEDQEEDYAAVFSLTNAYSSISGPGPEDDDDDYDDDTTTIVDTTPPLSATPEQVITIEEPKIPLAALPYTGASSNAASLLALGLMGALSAAVPMFSKKKKDR
jgi:LPXTG-motif cell wall-anchored protein